MRRPTRRLRVPVATRHHTHRTESTRTNMRSSSIRTTPACSSICHNLLSSVPSHLYSSNKGLSTLQFSTLSVDPTNTKHLMGGTQDNGTFETYGSAAFWPQIIYGDGGESGFDIGNPAIRFNQFFFPFTDVNFQNGNPTK